MNEIKDLKNQIISLNDDLTSIKNEITNKEKEVVNLINKNDLNLLLNHWQKLINYYNKYHPMIYNDIIITCFPIFTSVCCGIKGSNDFIHLNQLLDLWNNGYMFNDKPITNIIIHNSGSFKIQYIDNGEIVTKPIDKETAYNYRKIVKELDLTKTAKYSETNLADIFKG